jgi:hypothetical protein
MIKYDLDQDGYAALIVGNQVERLSVHQYHYQAVVLTTSVGVILKQEIGRNRGP